MSEVGEKFVFAEKFSTDPETRSRAKEGEELVGEIISKHEKEELDNERPLPEALARFSEKAKNWLSAYYHSLGLEGRDFSKRIAVVAPREEDGLLIGGRRHLGRVEVADSPIIDEDLKIYTQARTLVHELYHDSSNYMISRDGGIERQGLTYRAQKHAAVEEGLAAIAECRAKVLLFAEFPAGASKEGYLIDACLKEMPQLDPQMARAFGCIARYDNEKIVLGGSYLPAVDFVLYLSAEVPNFWQLAERARVLGETLPLARAIEGKFGSGSYKDVMTTTNENAGLRRKWLERKLAGQKEH